MAENSAIQWTDHTFNPWSGCSKVHEGCKHCYAEVNYSVKMRGVKWGPSGNRIKASVAMWREPLKWNRAAEKAGVRARVFCASLADVFEDWQGSILDHKGGVIHVAESEYSSKHRPLTMDDMRCELFKLIDATPNLDWQLLTKRPENIQRMWLTRAGERSEGLSVWSHRHNVWLGTSVSLQEHADKQINDLIKCHDLSPVLFLSAEPLLGPIDLNLPWIRHADGSIEKTSGIDWVIIGGEGGPGARPCNVEWIRDIRDQCQAAGVPVFVKQLGSNPWIDPAELEQRRAKPGYRPLRDKKGGEMAEWPDDLRVRQFPEVSQA